MVSRTLTARFLLGECIFTMCLQKVSICVICQDLLCPELDRRRRWPISLQKRNVHGTKIHCVGTLDSMT